LKKGEGKARGRGDLSNQISPNPSFSKRGAEYLHAKFQKYPAIIGINHPHR